MLSANCSQIVSHYFVTTNYVDDFLRKHLVSRGFLDQHFFRGSQIPSVGHLSPKSRTSAIRLFLVLTAINNVEIAKVSPWVR